MGGGKALIIRRLKFTPPRANFGSEGAFPAKTVSAPPPPAGAGTSRKNDGAEIFISGKTFYICTVKT